MLARTESLEGKPQELYGIAKPPCESRTPGLYYLRLAVQKGKLALDSR
jgi:hypothetical protein